MKQLSTNIKAVELECSQLEQARLELDLIRAYFIKNSFEVSEQSIKDAANWSFRSILDTYEAAERAKINNFINQFGKLAGLGNPEQNIKGAVKEQLNKIVSECPKVYDIEVTRLYFDMLEISPESVNIKKQYDKNYFIKKHTIYADPETFKKHIQLVELFNDLGNGTDNEFKLFTDLLYFDPETKVFQLNIGYYNKK